MIKECPHCFMRVVATANGECPACRRDMGDTSGSDATKTSLSVALGAVLPPFCCDCANMTDRYVKVRAKIAGDNGSGWATFFSVMISVITGVFVAGDDDNPRRRSSDTLVIRVPQCKLCASQGHPRPIRVNSEELRMTLVVDKKFKEKVVAQP